MEGPRCGVTDCADSCVKLPASKVFDVPGGFHLRVPIADYYSIRGARLEGVGLTPDVAVGADRALDVALGH